MNVVRYIFYMLAAVLLLLQTSCFDIVEDLTLTKNGSGRIELTVNLSKSKTKVASLMKLDQIDGLKIPNEKQVRDQVNELVQLLKKTSGIRNVQHELDFNQFIGHISCDFDNIEALNVYTSALSTHFNVRLTDYSNYTYQRDTGTLKRSYTHSKSAQKEFQKLSVANRQSISEAYYTSIYRIEGTVKKQTNPAGRIASNKKAVMVRVSLTELLEGKVGLSNEIVWQ